MIRGYFVPYTDIDTGQAVDFEAEHKKQPFDFVVLRAGRSALNYNVHGVAVVEHIKNSAYDGYVNQLKALGIPWVTVYQAYPWEWGNEQAQFYFDIIKDDMPVFPFVSLEHYGEWLPFMESDRIDFYNVFTGKLNSLTGGRYKPDPQVGLYTNPNWLSTYLPNMPAEFRKNVANFTAQWTTGSAPAVEGFATWTLWQKSQTEVYFNGTREEFEAWAKYRLTYTGDTEPMEEPEPEPTKHWLMVLLEWLIELIKKLIK